MKKIWRPLQLALVFACAASILTSTAFAQVSSPAQPIRMEPIRIAPTPSIKLPESFRPISLGAGSPPSVEIEHHPHPPTCSSETRWTYSVEWRDGQSYTVRQPYFVRTCE